MSDKQSLFGPDWESQIRENQELGVQTKIDSVCSEKARCFRVSALAKCLPPLLFATSILAPSTLLALGLGGVDTKSYIGQPLLVEIPLYNVESPNALKIELERVDGESAEGLSASLSRENSQLSVVIRSDDIVNEPYYNFALNIDDQGNSFRKELTVLLDLSPRSNSPVKSSGLVKANAKGSVKAASETAPYTGVQADTMGPYDWAQAGAIPKRFGAVLDGQALWRVARRISPAMGVSNNQMMWALYNANPSAFATNRIESLKAGVYLDIPDESLVKSISDTQAKQYLNALTSQSSASRSSDDTSRLSESKPELADQSSQEENVDASDETLLGSNEVSASSTERFQLTGLDERVSSDGALIGAQDSGSQEIINSLAQTVSSMTEQLSQKDKQIKALQEQVNELKAFIQNDEDVPAESLRLESSVAAIEEFEAEPSIGEEVSAVQPKPETNQRRLFAENWNLLPWLLLGILLAVLVLMRDRFVGFWKTINYSARKDEVDFQASELTQDSFISDAEEDQIRNTIQERTKQAEWQNESARERVITRQLASEEKEPNFTSDEDSTFHMSESEFSSSEFSLEEYSEMALEDDVAPPYQPASDSEAVSFQERFGQLIAQGESELASQLLDLARGNQVSASKYHFHKLQLLSLEKSEDPFYNYYSDIEAELEKFPQDVQTDISKLVVKMSQRSYEFG